MSNKYWMYSIIVYIKVDVDLTVKRHVMLTMKSKFKISLKEKYVLSYHSWLFEFCQIPSLNALATLNQLTRALIVFDFVNQ